MKFATLLPFAPLALAALCASCESSRVLDPDARYFTGSLRTYFDTGKDDVGELDLFKDGGMSAAVDFLSVSFPYLMHRGKEPGSIEAIHAAEVRKRDELDAKIVEKATSVEGLRTKRAARAANVAAEQARKEDAELAAAETDLVLLQLDRAKASSTLERAEKIALRSGGTRLDGDWTTGARLSFGMTGPAGDSSDGTNTSSGAPVAYLGVGVFADFQTGGSLDSDDRGTGVAIEAGYMFGVSADESLADSDDGAIYVGFSVRI